MKQLHKVGLGCAAAMVLVSSIYSASTQAGGQSAKLPDHQEVAAVYTSVATQFGVVPKLGLKRGLLKDQNAQIMQIATNVAKANGTLLADDGPGGRPGLEGPCAGHRA